jgi:hypothetical protein
MFEHATPSFPTDFFEDFEEIIESFDIDQLFSHFLQALRLYRELKTSSRWDPSDFWRKESHWLQARIEEAVV